jgi:hypothetical protein
MTGLKQRGVGVQPASHVAGRNPAKSLRSSVKNGVANRDLEAVQGWIQGLAERHVPQVVGDFPVIGPTQTIAIEALVGERLPNRLYVWALTTRIHGSTFSPCPRAIPLPTSASVMNPGFFLVPSPK